MNTKRKPRRPLILLSVLRLARLRKVGDLEHATHPQVDLSAGFIRLLPVDTQL